MRHEPGSGTAWLREAPLITDLLHDPVEVPPLRITLELVLAGVLELQAR
jgi:hypothetical protein